MSHLTARRKSVQSHLKSCRSLQRLSVSYRSCRSLSGTAPRSIVLSPSSKLRVQRLADLWARVQDGRSETIFQYTDEIYEVNGVLLRACRVIVLQELQSKVIIKLHQSHRGIVRMKTMARLYVWWPNIDRDKHRNLL